MPKMMVLGVENDIILSKYDSKEADNDIITS
jgi:hypothetical protein